MYFQLAGQSAKSRGLPLSHSAIKNLPVWAQAAFVRGWLAQSKPKERTP